MPKDIVANSLLEPTKTNDQECSAQRHQYISHGAEAMKIVENEPSESQVKLPPIIEEQVDSTPTSTHEFQMIQGRSQNI